MISSPGSESWPGDGWAHADVDGDGWSVGLLLVSLVQTVSPHSRPSRFGPALPCGMALWGACLHLGDGDRGAAAWLASASRLFGRCEVRGAEMCLCGGPVVPCERPVLGKLLPRGWGPRLTCGLEHSCPARPGPAQPGSAEPAAACTPVSV